MNCTVEEIDSTETGICVRCGRSHDSKNRQRLIRPMGMLEAREIAEEWPCFYPNYLVDKASQRRLFRDLAAVRQ